MLLYIHICFYNSTHEQCLEIGSCITVHHLLSSFTVVKQEFVILFGEYHNNIIVMLQFCSYQEAIEDITKRMGAGMAKFICKEVCNVFIILK